MENQGQGEQSNRSRESESRMSAATRSTLAKLKNQRRGRAMNPGTKTIIHDNSSPGFGWLLPGWLAQERHMDSGRIYRNYYDPDGNMYHSKHEILHAWEQSGMVVIDK